MNAARLVKVSSAKSAEEMRAILAKAKGNLYAEKHAEGYEVRDLRPLAERLTNPIKNRDMVRYFGMTHFVLTAKALARFPSTVIA